MKRNDYFKPHIVAPLRPTIQIGDGREEQRLKDRVNDLIEELERYKDLADRINIEGKESLTRAERLNHINMQQEAIIEDITNVNNQLQMEVGNTQELRGLLHVAELARDIAEHRVKVLEPRQPHMSQGAIMSQTGFKMPGFGDIVPRKSIGGAQPNLVQYKGRS